MPLSDSDDDDLQRLERQIEDLDEKIVSHFAVTDSAWASLKETMDAREELVGTLLMRIRAQPPWWAVTVMWICAGAGAALHAVQRVPAAAYTLQAISIAAAVFSLRRMNRVMREVQWPTRRPEPWPPSAKATVWAASIVTTGAVASAVVTAVVAR